MEGKIEVLSPLGIYPFAGGEGREEDERERERGKEW